MRRRSGWSAAVAVLLGMGLMFTGNNPSFAADCAVGAAGVGWPTQDWATAEPDRAALVALNDYAFAREGIVTDALLIARGDTILYEAYANGFGRDRRHITWSMSKSILHAVVGTAVARGLVDVDQPVSVKSPWLRGEGKDGITYRALLRMSSGIDFNESYEFDPIRSSVLAMLYTRGRADMGGFAASQPQAAAPGTAWRYSSGDSTILAKALRDAVGPAAYPDFPWTALFEPLGMRTAVWERDGEGVFVGSSYFYASARDVAKIGLLYLEDGCWAGQRLLPEGWVADAAMLAPPLQGQPEEPWWRLISGRDAAYGAGWWLNRPVGRDNRPPLDRVPTDVLVASGHWGQRLIILPGSGLILVRLGDDKLGGWNNTRFIELASEAFGRGPP